ncbi:MAG: DUF928 domain-containing protein [Hydrococcus sp. Prado102]|jgi:hypothetical protein|nr:DUF928 domain-containing protein [Hydrococcus sp. Prado102]
MVVNRFFWAILLIFQFELFGFSQLALAQVVYRPPPNRDRQSQRTETHGSRGCQDNAAKILLLIPNDHVATTGASHPTFLLYVSKRPSRPILWSVVEPEVVRPIVEQSVTVKQSGIVPVTIPPSSSGLEIGKTYVLTVGMLCNPKRPSASAYTRVLLKRVAITPAVERRLSQVASERERAEVYAQAGIWYDAIASSYTAMQQENSEAQGERDFRLLLEQVGLVSQVGLFGLKRVTIPRSPL